MTTGSTKSRWWFTVTFRRMIFITRTSFMVNCTRLRIAHKERAHTQRAFIHYGFFCCEIMASFVGFFCRFKRNESNWSFSLLLFLFRKIGNELNINLTWTCYEPFPLRNPAVRNNDNHSICHTIYDNRWWSNKENWLNVNATSWFGWLLLYRRRFRSWMSNNRL